MLSEARLSSLSARCLLEGDSQEEFNVFAGQLMRFLNPVNLAETYLADELVAEVWLLCRVARIESLLKPAIEPSTLRKYKLSRMRRYRQIWKSLCGLRRFMHSEAGLPPKVVDPVSLRAMLRRGDRSELAA